MKKEIKITLICLGAVLLIVGIVLGLNCNKKEYYITDNEHLYDVAIDYLREEEYQSNNSDADKNNYHFFFTYDGLGITEDGKYKYAYMWILGESYYIENEERQSSSGYSMFFKFTFKDNEVVKYDIPKDGFEYTNSIKELCLDSKMSNKIINYQSKLSNEEKANEYYSKVTKSSNLKTEDIIDNNGLLFSINWKKTDCIPVQLSIYDNNKYVLHNAYQACKPNETCNSMLIYTNKVEGTYDFDVIKIIQNSIIADNMQFTNDNMPEYEIYTGKGELVYMLITDKNNKYLNEFLKQIDIDLHTCATPDYK